MDLVWGHFSYYATTIPINYMYHLKLRVLNLEGGGVMVDVMILIL